eukprot:CAMPEP_0118638852 /NCGR_PEP_ID=MMETSP0785-20121206/3916_1 /TAXON_ID=91992 /ORGANISM="Bolidomonas pacifica, Strain CCMP 1866" /LENGTH=353 /DNA_ID=CAMNT_0006530151 /DNA_START=147 /DNA_END=1205 /DNA_ORIENTATION=+
MGLKKTLRCPLSLLLLFLSLLLLLFHSTTALRLQRATAKASRFRKVISSSLGPSFTIRGSSKTYAANATAASAAKAVGAPVPSTRAPRFVWRFAWEAGKRSLRVLHRPYITSGFVPNDSNVNLSVLYWKALDGDEYARDLLPGTLGRILTWRGLRWMYPRLHHANVGIRTRFIDRCLTAIAQEEQESQEESQEESKEQNGGFNVLILGSGFDSRGVKLMEGGGGMDTKNLRVVEFDLEKVVEEKKMVYNKNYKRRLTGRRSNNHHGVEDNQPIPLPKLQPIDLNDLNATREILSREVEEGNKLGLTTVIICEAVLIYVKDVRGVIRMVGEALIDGKRKSTSTGTSTSKTTTHF